MHAALLKAQLNAADPRLPEQGEYPFGGFFGCKTLFHTLILASRRARVKRLRMKKCNKGLYKRAAVYYNNSL